MKYSLLFASLFLFSTSAFSQIRTPPLSQFQTINQKVGFTEVTIEYCRPQMRGRTIFGGLEQYGEVWRTGANRNTQITFSESVTIGDTKLEAGTYTLFTRPNVEKWKVYFYPYDNSYGVPDDFSDDSAEATLSIPVFELNRDVQTLTINLENVTQNTADLSIMWERTYIAIPITFTTETTILSKIDDIQNGHASDYYVSAQYFLETNRDLDKAKYFIENAIDLRAQSGDSPKSWYHLLHANILVANNETKEAKKAAQKAMEAAKARDDNSFTRSQIKKIGELLEELK